MSKNVDAEKGKGKESEINAVDELSKAGGCLGARYITTFMLFLGMSNAYVMRTNMSVAIVAMVNHSALPVDKSIVDDECFDESVNFTDFNIGSEVSTSSDGEYVWDSTIQGYVLSSFFYGYVVTQIPFGIMAKKYGAKWFLGIGMLVNSVFAFFVPLSASMGIGWLIACRFIQGLGEGPIVPCTHALLAKWIPPNERSRMGAFIYAGAQFGTVISMPLSGLLAEYGFAGGWPSIFYVFGIIGTIWSVAYFFTVYEDPESHPTISEQERKYIVYSLWGSSGASGIAEFTLTQNVNLFIIIVGNMDTIGGAIAAGRKYIDVRMHNGLVTSYRTDTTSCNKIKRKKPKSPPLPWKSIFTSVPFWAIVIAHLGQNYGYETLMTELPTFMKQVLHFDIKSNGTLSALPYLAMWLFSMAASHVVDWMISSGKFTHTFTRKLINSIGQFCPAVALIAASYTGCNPPLTVALLTIGVGLNGGIYSGFKVNHLDVSPRFASVMMSFSNCLANIAGLLAPITAGYVIKGKPTQAQWRIVFLIAAGIYIACGLFYAIFSSGKRQKWDDPTMDEEIAEKKAKKNGNVTNGGLVEETGH